MVATRSGAKKQHAGKIPASTLNPIPEKPVLESSYDDFVLEPETQDRPKRGPKPGDKRKSTQAATPKKRHRSLPSSPFDLNAIPSLVPAETNIEAEFKKHNLDLANSSQSFQQFRALVKQGLKEKVDHEYTPNPTLAKLIMDFPKHRRYKLREDKVGTVDHLQPDGTTAKRWVVLVFDTGNVEANDIPLFLMPPLATKPDTPCLTCRKSRDKPRCDRSATAGCTKCNNRLDPNAGQQCMDEYNTLVRNKEPWAVMTLDVCQDKAKVVALGKLAAEIMNRAPFDLKTEIWASPVEVLGNRRFIVAREQAFVETVSLLEWKRQEWKEFDLNTLAHLQPGWHRSLPGDPYSSSWYGWPMDIKKEAVANSFGWEAPRNPPIFFEHNPDGSSGERFVLAIRASDIDTEAIDKAEAPHQSCHVFGPLAADALSAEGRCRKALQICSEQLVGLIGTAREIRMSYEDSTTRFYADKRRQNLNGPYGDQYIIHTRPSRWNAEMRFAAQVFQNLATHSKKSVTFARTFSIPDDELSIAWIMQQCLDSVARGEKLIQILTNTFVAAERVTQGKITRREMVESYCTCRDEDDASVTEHICVSCKTRRRCGEMRKEATFDGIGLVPKCTGCVGRVLQLRSQRRDTLEFVLYRNSLQAFAVESSIHGYTPTFSRSQLVQAVIAVHGCTDDPTSWICGYTGRKFSITAAKYPPGLDTYRIPHLLMPSYERPHQRYLRDDGKIVLHDTQVNLTIVPMALNITKGPHPPICMALLQKAAELQAKAADRPPIVGYYSDVATDWEILERAMLNEMIIASFSAHQNATRVKDGQDLEIVAKHISMERSGIWDGETQRWDQIFSVFPAASLRHPKFKLNDKYWHWPTILDDIAQMERSPKLNPHHLSIPRVGQLPWLWPIQFCPKDADHALIFVIFSIRLYRMDFKCDPKHKTEESPATLFLEYCAQWLERGGKCHIFGFIMVPFTGHIAVFSFGRGVVQHTADGGKRLIQPQEPMRTGCKVLLPTDMTRDYDITRRTVIVESWKANLLRFKYPNYPGLLKELCDLVRSVQPTTVWYDAMGVSLDHYAEVPPPTRQADLLRSRKNLREDLEEDFDLDEEENFYVAEALELQSLAKRYQERLGQLEEWASALQCSSHTEIKKLLEELASLAHSDLLEDFEQAEDLVEQLEHALQQSGEQIHDDNEAAPAASAGSVTMTADGSAAATTAADTVRLDLLKHHLSKWPSGMRLRDLLGSINNNLLEGTTPFSKVEFLDLLDVLEDAGEYSLVVEKERK